LPDPLRRLLARFLPEGAILLAVLTFGSYLAGLVRDRVFAHTFGVGPELDAYNAAFQLPELALDVLVAAGLTAPFVPVFTTLRRQDADAAIRFAQTVLTLAVALMAVACLVLLALAPQTVELIAPGFDAANRERYLDLFRIMLVTPIIFAASIALGEMLVAERRFLTYALAPILYNVGIVAGTLALHSRLGIGAAAVGAVIGALLHLGIRVIGILRTPIRIRPRLALRLPALHEFLRLMAPKMVSAPIEPLTFLYFNRVASTLAAGSVTALSFARNFQSVPVSMIGVAIAVAAFPTLSTAWAAGDRSGFVRQVRTSALTITVLTVAAAAGLVVVGPLAIEILLGGGAFDAEAARRTAVVLAALAVATPFESLGHLFARGLYSTHNTILPVLASVAGFLVTVAATAALVDAYGAVAIGFAFALGMAVRAGLQGVALAWRLRGGQPPLGVVGTTAMNSPSRSG
jgi:putative peptidoglycan lipid II flippase